MKKRILLPLFLGVLAFTSCKSDDDNNEPEQKCVTCEVPLIGDTEYCDNEDGTVTVTVDGEETTTSLNGISFDNFIEALEQSGQISCN